MVGNNFKFRAWGDINKEWVYSEEEDCFYINKSGVLFMFGTKESHERVTDELYKSYDIELYNTETEAYEKMV